MGCHKYQATIFHVSVMLNYQHIFILTFAKINFG